MNCEPFSDEWKNAKDEIVVLVLKRPLFWSHNPSIKRVKILESHFLSHEQETFSE